MCGRFYTITEAEQLEAIEILRQIQEKYPDQGISNMIVPTLPTPTITADGPGIMRFGFKTPYNNGMQINARSETLTEKPMFKGHFMAGRRCLIPTVLFYEPSKPDKKGYWFRPADGSLMYMAGIYVPGTDYSEYVIITRQADSLIAPHHDRMPLLIQSAEMRDAWLRSDELAGYILSLDPAIPLVMDTPA